MANAFPCAAADCQCVQVKQLAKPCRKSTATTRVACQDCFRMFCSDTCDVGVSCFGVHLTLDAFNGKLQCRFARNARRVEGFDYAVPLISVQDWISGRPHKSPSCQRTEDHPLVIGALVSFMHLHGLRVLSYDSPLCHDIIDTAPSSSHWKCTDKCTECKQTVAIGYANKANSAIRCLQCFNSCTLDGHWDLLRTVASIDVKRTADFIQRHFSCP